MKSEEIKSMMKKYGKLRYTGNRITGASVICNVCGKKIEYDGAYIDHLEKVDFVLTKRKDPIFVHTKCKDKAWDSKIKWED